MRALFLWLAVCGQVLAHDPISTRLTWSQEISRIVYRRCVSCHRNGGAAPMPLVTYEQARPWAKAIKEEVLKRSMPPWGAVKGFGEFRDDPSLTQDETNRIAEWVEGGAPEGDPVYLPKLPAPQPRSQPPVGKRVKSLKGRVTLLGIRPAESTESAQIVVSGPDGSATPLLWLHQYKSSWNRTFFLREPIPIPPGSRVIATPSIRFDFLVRD